MIGNQSINRCSDRIQSTAISARAQVACINQSIATEQAARPPSRPRCGWLRPIRHDRLHVAQVFALPSMSEKRAVERKSKLTTHATPPPISLPESGKSQHATSSDERRNSTRLNENQSNN